MRERSRENQQLMADRIVERFDAVEVTGLSRWEKERALVKAGWYGPVVQRPGHLPVEEEIGVRFPVGPHKQDPLFPDLEAA